MKKTITFSDEDIKDMDFLKKKFRFLQSDIDIIRYGMHFISTYHDKLSISPENITINLNNAVKKREIEEDDEEEKAHDPYLGYKLTKKKKEIVKNMEENPENYYCPMHIYSYDQCQCLKTNREAMMYNIHNMSEEELLKKTTK